VGYWLLLLLVIWPGGQALEKEEGRQKHLTDEGRHTHSSSGTGTKEVIGGRHADGAVQDMHKQAHSHLQGLAVRLYVRSATP
jgi:hypothetical protein